MGSKTNTRRQKEIQDNIIAEFEAAKQRRGDDVIGIITIDVKSKKTKDEETN